MTTPAEDPRREADEKPAEKPTTKLDKDEITRQLLDKVLLKLNEVGESQAKTTEGMTALGSEVRALGGKVDTVASDVHAVKTEQVEFREWKGAVEERFKTHSMGAKSLSIHDGTQDVKLQELENRLAVAAESSMRAILVEAREAAKEVAKTPMGQKLLTTGGYMLMALFAFGTAYFGAMTVRLQQQPQQPTTVVQQNAPSPPSQVDAGAK